MIMINSSLPCMVFSSSAQLCDEVGILSSANDIMTLVDLEHRFIRSLYDDADDFVALCASEEQNRYRLYKIRSISRSQAFRFAFCEKASVLGENLTLVYLARSISSFRPLMSPSSGLLRTPADRVIYELLSLREPSALQPPAMSVEAFSVMERIPCLCEALFDERVKAQYCDLFSLTEHILDKLRENPAVSAQFTLEKKRGVFSPRVETNETMEVAANLIELSIEAFVAVMFILSVIAASISSSHEIGVTVSFYSYAADIVLTTTTQMLPKDVRLASLGYLSDCITRPDLTRIAETIAFIAGIDLSVSYDKTSGEIKLVIGLGYEMQAMPDFKFSDALANVSTVLREMDILTGLL